MRIAFGIINQGHLPKILKMLVDNYSWDLIADEIGWEVEALKRNFRNVSHTIEFYKTRMRALQEWQKELPEPYRTEVCNILANGRKKP